MRYDVLIPMISDLPDARDGSFLFLKTPWGSDRQKMVMTVAANQLSHQPNGCKLGPKDGRWNPAGKVNALEVLWALIQSDKCADITLVPRPICGAANCLSLQHSAMMTIKQYTARIKCARSKDACQCPLPKCLKEECKLLKLFFL
jgi:hypothetical protein